MSVAGSMNRYIVEFTFRTKVSANSRTTAELKARNKIKKKLKKIVENNEMIHGTAYTKEDVLSKWTDYEYYGE